MHFKTIGLPAAQTAAVQQYAAAHKAQRVAGDDADEDEEEDDEDSDNAARHGAPSVCHI